MYRQLVAFAVVSFTGLQGAFAQANGGVCLSNSSYTVWTTNSMNQTPCQVANDLFAADPCNQTGISYGGDQEDYYDGPQASNSSACTCNTVIYSLTSACSACQGNNFLYWSEWTESCDANNTLYQEWPASIPSGTTIPPWAYLPLVNGAWDSSAAQNNASAVAQASTSASSSTAISSTTSGAFMTSTAPASGGSSASTTSASAGPTGAGTGGAGKMSASVGGAFAGAFLLSFLGVF
ncbi:hypothetical protein BJ138DRAFT_1106760 [Hygrophoropsis aurantiaca]|uniref:Uncharacterized protein n=1 Tax=Hygrophoropsis aurantiaca TaxID=72124 RepID=A0ACB7ZVX8_9AGAM|nr:hypothetical protein BJ138DRAFT_1106760 [Hygrophoropsis aurantiaca]